MKRIDRDNFRLESGREFSADWGIIGLSPDLENVCHGYDGEITEWDYDAERRADVEIDPFTADERRELADFMIALWERYARDGLRKEGDE